MIVIRWSELSYNISQKFQTSDFEPIIGQSPQSPPESQPKWQSAILKYTVAISEYFSISDLYFGYLFNDC